MKIERLIHKKKYFKIWKKYTLGVKLNFAFNFKLLPQIRIEPTTITLTVRHFYVFIIHADAVSGGHYYTTSLIEYNIIPQLGSNYLLRQLFIK